ncbi:MAG: hypothetical protein CVU64_00215 [Deltaproteobacteria bacterium HGW-Deltaproteobacteria-21]|nr:MAG: hypothetical protein CVU64_00215 [Deltaproteobacteria bacterium HGW-Deltaproteobacteria-21]
MATITKPSPWKVSFFFVGIYFCTFMFLFASSLLYHKELLPLDLRPIFLIFQFPGQYIWNSLKYMDHLRTFPSLVAVFIINSVLFGVTGWLIGHWIRRNGQRQRRIFRS